VTDLAPISLVLADDQELIRAGLRMVLSRAPGVVILAEASDGYEAISAVKEHRPDVVLMDIQMPRLDGLEACRRITADPSLLTKVAILTTFDLDEYVFGALSNGASAFLLKDHPPAELPAALRTIAAGDSLFAPTVTRRLVESFTRPNGISADAQHLIAGLTPRETDVLVLMADGLSNSEIAQTLFLGETTVKTHVGRILLKLHARDRVQVVITAFKAGLAGHHRPPGPPAG
jgi:DNA-binding NarL/FixJ family response regulator